MADLIDDDDLRRLRQLDEAATPPPWRSMIEGRDHWSGDNFIMIGEGEERGEDLYLRRDQLPASDADQDFVAASRNLIGPLLDEVERLERSSSVRRRRRPPLKLMTQPSCRIALPASSNTS